MYNQFITISESTISQQFKAPIVDIERSLQLLEKFEIIEYEKQNGLPKITFLSPRASVDNLPISWHTYLAKKESSKSKLDAIETYVRQNQFCRTTQISAYFGENIETTCGICDICIQEKRENSGKAYPEGNIQERKLILQYLKNGPMNLNDLVDCLRPLSKSAAIQLIQYSLERGEVVYADTETLALASS